MNGWQKCHILSDRTYASVSQYIEKPKPPDTMQLRTRGHKFQLPTIKYEFNKSNFMVRFFYLFVIMQLHWTVLLLCEQFCNV